MTISVVGNCGPLPHVYGRAEAAGKGLARPRSKAVCSRAERHVSRLTGTDVSSNFEPVA